MISDSIAVRIGSLTADRERFMPWRTVSGDGLAPKSDPELETVLKGVFHHRRFLDLLSDFIVFGDRDGETIKILAGYHQFHAVKRAVQSMLRALPGNSGYGPGAAEAPGLVRKAGPLRNVQIVAAADRVVAFWNSRTRETLNTVVRALSARKDVAIFGPDGTGGDRGGTESSGGFGCHCGFGSSTTN